MLHGKAEKGTETISLFFFRSRRGQLRQNACAQHVYISEHAGSEMQRERKIEIIERLEGRLEGDLDRILIIVIIYMGRGREREREI